MTPFLSVDSGANAGFAGFGADGRLLCCGLARLRHGKRATAAGATPYCELPVEWCTPGHEIGALTGSTWARWPLLIIEQPHEGRGKATQGDRDKMNERMGIIQGLVRAPRIEKIVPVRWKGTLDGDMMTARILSRWMTAQDNAIFHAWLDGPQGSRAHAHDVVDSIGMGIHWCRTQGTRV